MVGILHPDMTTIRGPLFKKARHAPKKPEAPSTNAVAEAIKTKDPRVDVLLFRRPDGSHYIKTRLYSHIMPNRVMIGEVECAGKSERELALAVAGVVGSSAEQFGEQYGDVIDPSFAAKVALDNLRRVLSARKS